MTNFYLGGGKCKKDENTCGNLCVKAEDECPISNIFIGNDQEYKNSLKVEKLSI